MFRDDVTRKIRDDMVARDEVSCSGKNNHGGFDEVNILQSKLFYKLMVHFEEYYSKRCGKVNTTCNILLPTCERN